MLFRSATPAALRALVIQQLTAHALAEDVKPAQRLKALELLGKVTEVAAFTERREIIKTTDAGSARAALLETLRQALRSSAIDAKIITANPAKGNSVTLQAVELVQPGSQDAAQAAAHPDIGFIGSEVFLNGVGSLVRHVAAGKLDNVRVFDDDVRLLLPSLPGQSLARVKIGRAHV